VALAVLAVLMLGVVGLSQVSPAAFLHDPSRQSEALARSVQISAGI
jgi:hypothetical protein